MRSMVLSIHPGLADNSRLPALPQQRQWSRTGAMCLLLGAGVAAAVLTVALDLGLRMPGNAILRAVFPMALGLSLAPRRMGGSVMATGALGSLLVIKTGGLGSIGPAAMTSLLLAGPFLDAALWRAKRGWRLYLAFAVAGLATNLAAFGVRTASKLTGLDHPLARPFATWSLQAVGTYALFGIVAGVVSAAVWFQFSGTGRSNEATS